MENIQHIIVEFREGFNAFKGGTIYHKVVIGAPQDDERYTECEDNPELSYIELNEKEVARFKKAMKKGYTMELQDKDAKVYHPINGLKNFKELYNE